MPLGVKPECIACEAKEATIWRKEGNGLLCNDCFEKKKENEKKEEADKRREEEAQIKSEHTELPKPSKIVLRKSTRMTRKYKTRSNPYALPKPILARGRGRKSIQRRTPVCAPPNGRSWLRTNRVYQQDGFLQVGDVVSIVGADSTVYYAQLRGFLSDAYGDKRAVITWLLPKPGYSPGLYSPSHFYPGPDEDTPRRMTAMEFEYRPPTKSLLSRKVPLLPNDLESFVVEPIRAL